MSGRLLDAGKRQLTLLALLLLCATPLFAAEPQLELDIELDPDARRLQAVAHVTTRSGDVRFPLHESLSITGASAGGRQLQAVIVGRRAGAQRMWQVAVPRDADRLRVEYGGTLPALQRDLDHRGVLRALPPMASKEGSFLPAGSAWYPQPAGLFSYTVRLSLPADQRALVAGRLVSEELPSGVSGRYRARFEFGHPTDGIDLMAGPWLIREKLMPRAGMEPVKLRTYFFADLDAVPGLADAYLDDTRRYIERYSEAIGPYPFTEFSVVASPLPTGFGMPTLTFVGAQVLRLPFIRATSLGHEVLHNWWGNGVYVDYDEGNWAEGLTTFMADYAYKEDESAAAAREMRLGWLRDFAAVPSGDHRPLASFRSRTHGAAAAVGYGKSAMLFVMLRDTIGEAAFENGLRDFWRKHRFAIASWRDLQASFEAASGSALDPFFEQWLHRAGGPSVRLSGAEAAQHKGRTRLILRLEQTPPAYSLHLPIELDYEGRSEMRWVDIAHERETAALELDAPPTGVRLDPDVRVWRRLEREQLPPILRLWFLARAPRLLTASDDPRTRQASESLAQRLFEASPQAISVKELDRTTEPVLLVGLHADIDGALSRARLPGRPESVSGRGTAQVWTIERQAGAPVAVVSARDAEALLALLRPLPHYGSQSWLVFEGSRALDRGVWPAPGRILPVRRSS